MTDPTLTLQKKNNEKKRTQNLRPFFGEKSKKLLTIVLHWSIIKTTKENKTKKRKAETIMTKYGKEYKMNEEEWENIASYMNDEIREDLHFEMAPCEPEEFLRAYVEKDPDFEELLNSEFSIEL